MLYIFVCLRFVSACMCSRLCVCVLLHGRPSLPLLLIYHTYPLPPPPGVAAVTGPEVAHRRGHVTLYRPVTTFTGKGIARGGHVARASAPPPPSLSLFT